MTDKIKYTIFAIILSVITIAITSQVQPQISFNDGYGWDGVKYQDICQNIINNETISTKAPFVYRVGVPFLVAKLCPNDIKSGFLWINWLFSIVNAILLALLLAKFINRKWLIYLSVFFYVTTWHSYFRFGSFYPVQVDPLAISLILLSLLILIQEEIHSLDIILISLISLFGAFVREIVIIPSVLLLIKVSGFSLLDKTTYRNMLKIKQIWTILPLVLFLLAYFFVRVSVEQTNSHRFYNAAADMLYTKSLFRFFHSWFVTYGAVLIVPILYYKRALEILKNQRLWTSYLAIIIVFSYIGGADTERIAYWGFPVIFFITAKIIDDMSINKGTKSVLYGLFVIQIISQRLFNIIPDFPNSCNSTVMMLTPVGNCFPYLNLFPSHSELIPAVIGFAEWCLVLFFFIYLKKKAERI